MKKRLLTLAVVLLAVQNGFSAPSQPEEAEIAALRKLISEFQPQTGAVVLKDGLATVNVPEGLQYLNQKDAQSLLVKIWGNPPDSASQVIGMIIQSPKAAVSEDGWGIVITYKEDGHVDDADAAKIDYTSLLKQMKEGTVEANKERAKNGYKTAELIGWAEPPHYDPSTHKIYWAKDIAFAGSEQHTLNYCTRILGRRGVLELNAIASLRDLPAIRGEANKALAGVDFNSGNRYADYNSSTDKLATYGIAALVAGGVAAKMGFFKVLLVALLAAKKLVILGFIAVVSGVKKLFGRKK